MDPSSQAACTIWVSKAWTRLSLIDPLPPGASATNLPVAPPGSLQYTLAGCQVMAVEGVRIATSGTWPVHSGGVDSTLAG